MKLSSILGPTIGLLLLATALVAADIEFDGETYVRKDAADSPQIRRAEYVRDNETLDHWTKLIAIRNFKGLSDPMTAVADFAGRLKEQKPPIDADVLVSDDKKVVMIQFIISSPDGTYAEFNLHRYLKRDGYPGLISYQFAYRVTDSPDDDEKSLARNMYRWTKAMSEADFQPDFDK